MATHAVAPEIVVTPPRKWSGPNLRELWQARELMYFIMKRELQLRYKQSFFGVLWVVVQPLAIAGVFGLFFGSLAKIPSEGVPYPLFVLTGLLTWIFASQAVGTAAASLVGDSNLVAKVYFPRLAIPLGRIFAVGVDLLITLVVVLIAIVLYDTGFRIEMLLLPVFVLLAFVTAVGVGLPLAAVNVKYRDIGMALPLAIQLWLFLTPVLYPGSLVTGNWQYVYALNPMVTAVQGTRWALIGTPPPSLGAAITSVVVAALLLLAGTLYFRRAENHFADII